MGLSIVTTKPTISSPVQLTVEATQGARGGQLSLLLTIRHSGAVPDRYHVELRDIPRDWYTLDKPTVTLHPGAEERVQLVVYPPGETLAAPDTSAITIRVTSETDPAIHTSAVVALPLHGGGGWRMDLAPSATRGRTGAFRVTLLNQTPRPAAVSLVARDIEGALRIRVDPEGPVIVPPGCESLVAVDVAPRAHAANRRPHTYEIEVRGVQLGREAEANFSLIRWARYTHTPSYAPSWSPRTLILAALVVFGLALLALAGVHALRRATSSVATTSTPGSVGRVLGGVGVGQTPSIQRFALLRGSSGRPDELVWVTSNATQVLLNGTIVGAFGGRVVPAAAPGAAYVLVAGNGASSVTRRVYTSPAVTPPGAPFATAPSLPVTPPSATAPSLPAAAPTAPPLFVTAAQSAAILVNPIAVRFDRRAIATTNAPRTIRVVNLGPVPLRQISATLMGTGARYFRVRDICSGAIAVDDSCRITVTFVPTDAGSRYATLVIADNATHSLQKVTLSGAS